MSIADDESNEELSSEGIPPELFTLAERLHTLRDAMYTFRGWDTDIASLKHSTIFALSSWKKTIRQAHLAIQEVTFKSQCCQEELKLAHCIGQKIQYIMGHIPRQFNCPSKLNQPFVETKLQTVRSNNNAAANSQVVNGASGPCSNVPKILFLTMEEFENVPKYLKGRVTYEKVNTFIELLNRVLSSKYAIFKKRKATLKKKDADLWNEFYKQELKETKGLYFCVANDFKNLIGTVLDKSSLNLMTIIRHCGRVREVRTGGILRYVAMF